MKWWKKVVLWTIGIVILFLSSAMLTAYLLQDKIKAAFISIINEQTTQPIQVKGDIDFSILKHFPFASLSFSKVEINDRVRNGKNNLLQLDEFSFLINIRSLFSNKIEAKKVFIKNGSLTIFISKTGVDNYSIFKQTSGSSSKNIHFDLQEAIMENVRFNYISELKNEFFDADVKHLLINGKLNMERFDLSTKGELFIKQIRSNNEVYLAEKKVQLDLLMDVQKSQSKFGVKRASIEIEQNKFLLSGYFISKRQSTFVDFNASCEGENIAHLINLIPVKFKSQLSGTTGKGNYAIHAKISGEIDSEKFPALSVKADLKNASIHIKQLSKSLENVSASSLYTIDSTGHDRLAINDFHSTFSGDPFHFSLILENLKEPDFDFNANGVCNLKELEAFFGELKCQNVEGKIHFDYFHISGNKRDFQQKSAQNIQAKGSCRFELVEVQKDDITYGNVNGKLDFEKDYIKAENFTLNFLGTDFKYDGSVGNIFPYTYNLIEHQTPTVPLLVNGRVQIEHFDLSNILKTFDKKGKLKSEKSTVDPGDIFMMKGDLDVKVNEFSYNKAKLMQLEAKVQLSPQHIQIQSLNCHLFGGDLQSKGTIRFDKNKTVTLLTQLTLKQIEIPQLFYQLDNFSQTTLTDKNLKGKLNADVLLNCSWLNYKQLDLANLTATLKCSVHDGELNNFEPLKAASKFLDINELSHITFSDLENELVIKNSVITIPQMEVKSSLLNLFLSGKHQFDNEIDYALKVNLRKALASKFDKRKSEVQYIEEDAYEGLNLFLRLTGKIPDIKIKYDKTGLKNKIKEEFKSEKEELKNLFKKEANPKNENTKEKTREDKYFDTKHEPVFIDFEEEK